MNQLFHLIGQTYKLTNQEIIWRDAYDEFYNNGDLVFNLSDQQVLDLTGVTNSGGNYSFQNYQDTTDALLPMTGYLNLWNLNADGVWVRSTKFQMMMLRLQILHFYVFRAKIQSNS